MTTVTVRIERLALQNFRAEPGGERSVAGLIAREVERQLPRTAWSRAAAVATEKAVTDRIVSRQEGARG